MLHRRLTNLLAPLAFTALLFLSACTDNDPVAPGSQSVEGTWQIMTGEGEDMSFMELFWTFTNTKATYSQGLNSCITNFTYTVTGNKMVCVVVSDGCLNSNPGARDTIAFTIKGDNMTMVDHGETYILKKVSPANTTLLGTWEAETIDGETSSTGNRVFFEFTPAVIRETVSNGTAKCETMFAYSRAANKLTIEVTSDDCGELNPGDSDLVTYSIAANKLTMVFLDGTTIVCKKV